MKLSDLPPEEQERIVNARLEDTRAFTAHALTSRDPVVLLSLELDAQARRMGIHMEYSEEAEEGE